jgi:hypothetical protein
MAPAPGLPVNDANAAEDPSLQGRTPAGASAENGCMRAAQRDRPHRQMAGAGRGAELTGSRLPLGRRRQSRGGSSLKCGGSLNTELRCAGDCLQDDAVALGQTQQRGEIFLAGVGL